MSSSSEASEVVRPAARCSDVSQPSKAADSRRRVSAGAAFHMARGFLAADAPATLLGLEGLGATVADDLRFVLRELPEVDSRRSAAENAHRAQVVEEVGQNAANSIKALIVAAPALVAIDAALDALDCSADVFEAVKNSLEKGLRDACCIGSDAVRLWAAGVSVMGAIKLQKHLEPERVASSGGDTVPVDAHQGS